MVEHRPSLLPPPLGTLLDGRYRLDRLIGQGGMGAVYEACTPEGEPVAVKLLLEIPRSKRGTLTISRFLREAKLMADLDSPHIVPALDAGWDDALGLPFLVLPLLRGLDLADLLAKLEVLSPQLAVRIACQACRALVAAHEAGVVHRDIKPENLFLDHDEQGRINVRVLDFGIAKSLAEDGQLTATGNVMGTPHYMSPEQALSSKHVDGRTDVWSLGATLYRALCGEVPFGLAATPTEVLLALHTRPVPALQSQAPWIEPELAAVVHGALIRDPAARCPSAAALLAALEPHAGGSTTLCADMLASLPAELRTRQAVLAELPDRWPEPSASETAAELPGREPDPLLGKVLGDRFTLTRVMGRGGMGSVYEAEAAGGGRVAVKVIDPELAGKSQSARRRFVREARAAMSLDHDHVVKVIAADTDPDRELPFIAMEMLTGVDLAALIERNGAMAPAPIAQLFGQACRGLAAAHAIGLVHRDIKPANLFLHQMPDGALRLKICDFGIAKHLTGGDAPDSSTELTRTGGVVGSPMYMSPEQAKNARDVDRRTDVWSLGVSLYHALCGESPWSAQTTVGELIVAICTAELPHLQDRAPWIPRGLAEAVHRALAKEREGRFATMADFAAALRPFAGDDEIVTAAMLAPVPDQMRRETADRAALPSTTTMNATTVLARSIDEGRAVRRRPTARRPLLVGLAVAAVAGTSYGLWRASISSGAGVEPGAPAGTLAPSAVPAGPHSGPAAKVFRVEIGIAPREATVTVDGRESALVGGKLVIEGRAGDPFVVVATHEGRKAQETVVIKSDGTGTVAAIEVPGAASAASSAPTADPARKPAPPRPAAAPRPRDPVDGPAPPATPAPPPPVETSPPPFDETWESHGERGAEGKP